MTLDMTCVHGPRCPCCWIPVITHHGVVPASSRTRKGCSPSPRRPTRRPRPTQPSAVPCSVRTMCAHRHCFGPVRSYPLPVALCRPSMINCKFASARLGRPDALGFCNVIAGLCVMDLEDRGAMNAPPRIHYIRPVVDYSAAARSFLFNHIY